MYVARGMGTSSLHVSGRCACVHALRSAKISIHIHWTIPRNFHILHDPQILHCLKVITDYRNVRVRLRVLRAPACMYCFQIFLGASSIPTWSLYQVSSTSEVISQRNWGVHIAQSACMFSRAVHARARKQTFLINWVDQFENTLKVSGRSDLIWLRYWGTKVWQTNFLKDTQLHIYRFGSFSKGKNGYFWVLLESNFEDFCWKFLLGKVFWGITYYILQKKGHRKKIKVGSQVCGGGGGPETWDKVPSLALFFFDDFPKLIMAKWRSAVYQLGYWTIV